MKLCLFCIITFILAGFGLSCSKTTPSNEVQTSMDSVVAVDTDSIMEVNDSTERGGSLNDIRFANFTDKDWYDNEYIRTLRNYIDAFNKGEVEDAALESCKDDVKGKFVVANVEPFLLGGLYIQILFIDKPENVFTAWVYSDVDEETETVVDYSLRSLDLEEMKNTVTKEQVYQKIQEDPTLKLW